MIKTRFTPAQNVPAYFSIGARHIKGFVIQDNGGDLSSVTGWTWELAIKKNAGTQKKIISLTLGNGLSYAPYTNYTLVADLSAIQTSIEEGEYFWQLTRTDISQIWLSGPAHFSYKAPTVGYELSDDVILNIVDETLTINLNRSESGTVFSFSAGNLSPLFTALVATPTSTPVLTFSQVNQEANLVFAGPTTGAAAPTFRSLVAADIPALDYQATLVSGTNIKTINSTSLLGSGNISIVASSELSDLTAATGTNTINNASYAQEWQWETLGAGTGLLLSSSATDAASNTQTVFRVNQTGANASSTQTTYGGYFSNTKTGTSSTNVGLYATASGGTNNYAIYVDSGELKFAGGGTIANTTGNLTISTIVNFSNGQVILSGSRLILFNGGNGTIAGDTNSQLAFRSNYSTSTTTPYRFWNTNTNYTATNGTLNIFQLETNIAPTSGTAVFNAYTNTATINQTGGANGRVTLHKLNPTITAAVDVIGYDYNPASGTATSELAFRATQGGVLIGGTSITPDAILDIQSTTEAFLPPRMTEAQRDAIGTPSVGMVVYNTDTNLLNFHNGSAWGAI